MPFARGGTLAVLVLLASAPLTAAASPASVSGRLVLLDEPSVVGPLHLVTEAGGSDLRPALAASGRVNVSGSTVHGFHFSATWERVETSEDPLTLREPGTIANETLGDDAAASLDEIDCGTT